MQQPPDFPLSTSMQGSEEQIEYRINLLIKHYLSHPRKIIAQAIADHFVALLACPTAKQCSQQRCRYLKLAAHWRCLAWVSERDNEHGCVAQH